MDREVLRKFLEEVAKGLEVYVAGTPSKWDDVIVWAAKRVLFDANLIDAILDYLVKAGYRSSVQGNTPSLLLPE